MTPLPRARLSGYREQSGAIRFRIASAPDIHETTEEIKRRIPSWARRYDERTREWIIKADYRPVIESIFANAPGSATSTESPARASSRDAFGSGTFGTEERYTSRARMLWFVLAFAAVVGSGALLWSRNPAPSIALAPTATTAAPIAQAAAPAAPIEPVSLPGRVNSIVNLRAGPSTSSAIIGKAAAGDEVNAIGKFLAPDNYWWLVLEGGLWIRSDLVVRAEPGELPLNLAQLPMVDQSGRKIPPTEPPPTAEAVAGTDASGTGSATGNSPPVPTVATGNVLFVVDGETLHVNIGGREVRVRYIGIDTPERGEPGSQAATEANRSLVAGKTVRLISDAEEMDSYGRLLRYVYVDHDNNPATPEIFVNRALLEAGWAELLASPTNKAYAAELSAAHAQAQAAGAGLWE